MRCQVSDDNVLWLVRHLVCDIWLAYFVKWHGVGRVTGDRGLVVFMVVSFIWHDRWERLFML